MTPDKFTNEELMLDVGDGHTLYVHDWGKKDTDTPILFLHGGPGSGCSDGKKNQFFPERQRVIFFDQRGSDRSLPLGSLDKNDTEHQIADIDKILQHFGMEQVVLTGGSWGSALAFFYAIARPEKVKALVVDGVWTGSKSENDWLDKGQFRTFYPDAWQRYVASVPEKYRENPSEYHFSRILGEDQQAAKASALAYVTLEGAAISLDDRHGPIDAELFDPGSIRIEVQYLTNGCFVPDRYVFDNAAKLTMPVYMVQGRYDMVCPPITAHELHGLLPNSELIWTTSGHHAERETWNIKRMLLLQLTEGK